MSQILAFTFPHVGNVGVNMEDVEQIGGAPERATRRRHLPRRADRTRQLARDRQPGCLDEGARRGRTGRRGHPRPDQDYPRQGRPHAVIAHNPEGQFDLDALVAQAKAWTGLVGLDLAKEARRPRPLNGPRASGLADRLRQA